MPITSNRAPLLANAGMVNAPEQARNEVANDPPSEQPLPAPWSFFSSGAESDGEDKALSSSAQTYTKIKNLILGGHVRPGSKLVHQDLALHLNVSRTPVREALERLYQEGFVSRLPRRGFYVAEMTDDEARDLYGAREALEIHALRETLNRGPIPVETLARLNDMVETGHGLLKERAVRQRVSLDIELHLALAELSGNLYLLRLLSQTFERLNLKRRTEGYRSDRGETAVGEHRDLIAALKGDDAMRAELVLRTHIRSARDALLNTLG